MSSRPGRRASGEARLVSAIRTNALILVVALSLVTLAPRFGYLEHDQYVSYAVSYVASIAAAAGTWLRLPGRSLALLLTALAVAMIATVWMAVDMVLAT